MIKKFKTNSKEETVALGKKIAKQLAPGILIALVGDLGSGKTTMIQGIANGLGAKREEVKSPTFILFHIYKSKIPVYHFDLYRLESSKQFEEIGFDEFALDPNTIVLIEWADRADSILPKDRLQISLKETAENRREISINATGLESKKILKKL